MFRCHNCCPGLCLAEGVFEWPSVLQNLCIGREEEEQVDDDDDDDDVVIVVVVEEDATAATVGRGMCNEVVERCDRTDLRQRSRRRRRRKNMEKSMPYYSDHEYAW